MLNGFPLSLGAAFRALKAILACLALLVLEARPAGAAVDPATLPPVGYHPGGVAYWSHPVFANGLAHGGGWNEYSATLNDWGSGIVSWNTAQFDANGYPKYLNAGRKLRAVVLGLHMTYGGARPATWPDRAALTHGRVVLEWTGNADVRLNGPFTYLTGPGQSSGAETGTLSNGRRVYLYTGSNSPGWIEVHAITTPITDIKVWMPDPADPSNASLEDQLFHPYLLERIADADWGYIRFMDWNSTNASPQQDWTDRRPPTHVFMSGELNPRSPGGGHAGNRGTGVAFEHMVALCNATDKDLWITVPHLATDDFVTKLAQLIRYGSDGTNPYTSPQASPVYPPLEPGRRVFVEYSNEIWSSGGSFPQGDWAYQQGQALGISKEQFNARRFCQVWRLFQQVYGGTTSLVRVGAVFTAGDFYTNPFLTEMAAYGPTLSPAVEPDVIAATTYFGNGIQDWVLARAVAQAGTADPWFATGATFDAGGGNLHPVTLPAADPYWTSANFARHQDEAFDEWTRALLSGDAREGAGPDATGIGGGFDQWLYDMAQTKFPTPKPIIAYEGGPSVYTDGMDWGDSRDDGVTIFMEAMNRHPRIADVYRIHLNQAHARGLWSHTAFVDMGSWGKYGQWGHLEYGGQPLAQSPKWQFLLEWFATRSTLNHIEAPSGAVPGWTTAHKLPTGIAGTPYTVDLVASGGDGTPSITVLGQTLPDGITVDTVPGDAGRLRVSGTTGDGALGYVMARVKDANGDAAWRTFTLRVVGGPGTLLESNLEGTNPAQNLPWMPTYVLASGATTTGWTKGTGTIAHSGDNALVWSQNMPANEVDSTLALAIADNEYWAVSVAPSGANRLHLRGAEVRLRLLRIDYHAPRRYAVFTSIGGFAAGQQVFTAPYNGGTDEIEHVFTLPDTAAYENLSTSVQFRLVGYAGQYGGHKTSLTSFKLNGVVVAPQTTSNSFYVR